MQTQSEGLHFYFEIAMYNKSHIKKYVGVLILREKIIFIRKQKWTLISYILHFKNSSTFS